jgi:type II secretory pathway component GspD/PulD (secretin)
MAAIVSIVVAAGCSSAPPPERAPIEVEAQVDEGSAPHRLAQRVWGRGPAGAEASADPAQEPEPPTAAGAQEPEPPAAAGAQQPQTHAATLRARFGSNILVAEDGTITKQYFLSGEAGSVFLNLLREPAALAAVGTPQQPTQRPLPEGPVRVGGSAQSDSILGQMLGEHEVEVLYLDDFERPEGVVLRPNPQKPVPVLTGEPPPLQEGESNNLLLVTAQPDALAAFEGALDLFFGSIPQVEIEIKVVEYSTSNTLAFGVTPIDDSTPTFTRLVPGTLIGDIVSRFPLTAPSVAGTEFNDRGIITLGGIHDHWALNARLEALEAAGIADILTSPRLVVRNGGTARVTTQTDFPYPEARISSSGQNVTANIAFKPVGIQLTIRPVVAGTETVILQVYASISAVTGFADTDPVQTPVIAAREVITSVHVADGKTTVIGGLVTSSTFDQVSQVPILGDIPVLGYLFRSTSKAVNKTTLEFHITPHILQGAGGYVGG